MYLAISFAFLLQELALTMTMRNSQQINQRLPPPGRASRASPERRPAKELLGSDRPLKETIATSRRDDDRDESNPNNESQMIDDHRNSDDAKRYPYAKRPMETALA